MYPFRSRTSCLLPISGCSSFCTGCTHLLCLYPRCRGRSRSRRRRSLPTPRRRRQRRSIGTASWLRIVVGRVILKENVGTEGTCQLLLPNSFVDSTLVADTRGEMESGRLTWQQQLSQPSKAKLEKEQKKERGKRLTEREAVYNERRQDKPKRTRCRSKDRNKHQMSSEEDGGKSSLDIRAPSCHGLTGHRPRPTDPGPEL